MPDKNIYQVIQQFNKSLDAREKEQWIAMATRWKQTEDTLGLYIQRHADAIAARKAAGLPVTEYAYTKLDTWKDLQRQIIAEGRKYENYATATIKAEQLTYLETGAAAAQSAITAELGTGYAFNKLNTAALENMVGITADGSPLFDVLQKRALSPDMVEGLVNKLNEAIALGYNPRKTAAMMAEGLAAGLDKALVIARTEQLRAYRTASQEQYKESGVVSQYQRHAAASERTCLECIALDGKIYSTDVDFETHPQCRCFMTPIIDGVNPPGAKTLTWFENQPEAKQREIMGNSRYELYKAGTPLDAFVKVTNDPTWGNTISAVPLAELRDAVKNGSAAADFVSGNVSMEDFEARIVKQDYETAGVYSTDGTLLFEKDGEKDRVIFTNDELKQMKGAVLTHNHPSGNPLSHDDVAIMASTKMQEIRAVGSEYIYVMRNAKNDFSKPSFSEMERNWEAARRKADEVNYLTSTPFTTHADYSHQILTYLDESFGGRIKYTRIKR